MTVGHGPVEPGGADAEAVDAAVLEVGEHLGRRQGLQVHVAVGVDRVGGQPVAQQQVVHRSRMHDAEGMGFAVVALQPGPVVVHVVDARLGEPTGQGDAVAVTAQGEGAHHRQRLIAVAARRHPGRHARGHQGRVEGAIEQAIGDPAPAGFPHQLHLIETVLGEQALGLGHRQRRAGRQGHEPQVEIHLFQAVAGQHLVGLGLPLLHPLLAVKEVDDLRAQAVVARVVHHGHPLARPRDVHLQDAADL